MPKRAFAIRLAACLLAGCLVCPAPRAAALWDPFGFWGGFDAGDGGDGWQAPGGTAAPLRSETQRAYGSAGLVAWPGVLISVYLDEQGGERWDDDEIARSRRQLAVAMEWIGAQCAAYHAAPAIRYDTGEEGSGLYRYLEYPGRFRGGEDADEGDDFYDAIDALCAELDTDALHERYGTSSVGFLIFLPVAGSDFTIVHYCEDGSDFYYEYSCLYQYDIWSAPDTWNTPAVYAHEILHLFGAPDLYDGSTDPYVTPELLDYVLQNWPDAIMADTYGTGGPVYDRVDRALSPLTAYRLGLCGDWPGLADFPDTAAAPAAVFTLTNAPPGYQDALLPV